jgi:hypothetical protein
MPCMCCCGEAATGLLIIMRSRMKPSRLSSCCCRFPSARSSLPVSHAMAAHPHTAAALEAAAAAGRAPIQGAGR